MRGIRDLCEEPPNIVGSMDLRVMLAIYVPLGSSGAWGPCPGIVRVALANLICVGPR